MKIINIIRIMCASLILLLNSYASSGFWDTPNAVTGHVNGNIKLHFGDTQTWQPPKSQGQLDVWHSFQLANECRRRLVSQLSTQKEKILNLMSIENITVQMRNTLEKEIETLKFYNHSVGYSQDTITKLSLLSSRTLPWATTIKHFSDAFPDQLFNSYTFEDSLFIIFLQPKYPMLTKYYSKYKSDIVGYTNWLTKAMEKTLEITKRIKISYNDPEYKQFISENTLRQIYDLLPSTSS